MFFPYRYDPLMTALLLPIGVRADRDGVRLGDDSMRASFGFFDVDVPYADIDSVAVTGPYRWYRALGLRLSLADHGATFGTSARGGVCMQFTEPIDSIVGPWRHPGLTVTVADPDALATALHERIADS